MKNFTIFIGFCFSLSIHSQIQNVHYGTGALNQIATGHGNGSRNSAFGVSALFANSSRFISPTCRKKKVGIKTLI
jgi:hypothetical protein